MTDIHEIRSKLIADPAPKLSLWEHLKASRGATAAARAAEAPAGSFWPTYFKRLGLGVACLLGIAFVLNWPSLFGPEAQSIELKASTYGTAWPFPGYQRAVLYCEAPNKTFVNGLAVVDLDGKRHSLGGYYGRPYPSAYAAMERGGQCDPTNRAECDLGASLLVQASKLCR